MNITYLYGIYVCKMKNYHFTGFTRASIPCAQSLPLARGVKTLIWLEYDIVREANVVHTK